MAYRASRAAGSASTIVGTDGDDHILVTAPAAIDGLGGFDTLHFDFIASPVGIDLDLSQVWSGGVGRLNGYEIRNMEALGSAYLDSDTENNIIVGSAYDDVFILGAGYLAPTIIYGDEGNDLLVAGGGGSDDPVGGRNFLHGGSGDDVVIGNSHGDDLIGEDGDDRMFGGGGIDLIFGQAGRDLLHGGDGNDHLLGGAGNDRLFGDAGDDRLDGALGNDRIDGGTGSDSVEYYWAEGGGVIVNLTAGVAHETAVTDGSPAGAPVVYTDRLTSIENAAGTFFSDVLIGSGAANILTGDRGDDALYGRGGDDRLSGGSGDDRLEGGDGADLFVFGQADGDAGTDIGSDRIADFDRAEGDLIDLSGIDADRNSSYEDDAFVIVGEAAFSGTAGELRIVAADGGWEASGDYDGDGAADFSILIASPAQPLAGDFIL